MDGDSPARGDVRHPRISGTRLTALRVAHHEAIDALDPDAAAEAQAVQHQGVDGLMVRYAQCCQPVPGDAVVGYVTQGRGISIHRSDCPNLLVLSTEAERRVEIDWQESEGETFVVRLAVGGEDRRGLYADI